MRKFLISLGLLVALTLTGFGKTGSIDRGGSISKEEFQSILEHCQSKLPKLWTAINAVKNQDVHIKISNEKMSGPGKASGIDRIVLNSRFLVKDNPNFPEDRLIIVLYHEFGHIVFNRKTPHNMRNPVMNEFAAFSYSLMMAKKMAEEGDTGPLLQVTRNLIQRKETGNQRQKKAPHTLALNKLIGNELWQECIALLGQASAVKEPVSNSSPDDKIDPLLQRKMNRGQALQVTILCRTQLLKMPNGFAEFCQANATANRRELRSRVIKELKTISENGEQQAIMKLIPSRGNPVQHWIVNAISARLTQKQLTRIAEMEEVKYIYAGFPPLPPQKEKRLSQIIQYTQKSPNSKMRGTIPWNLKAIGADQVWKRKNIAGENVVVAMVEGGVDYTHQDLRNNLWINRDEKPDNGLDDDGNGWIDDYYGFNFRTGTCEVIPKNERHHHGTMTSGIVVGDGSGGIITGVAPRAKVMLLSGHAVYAYQYALDNGADILSMSFSVPKLGNGRGLWRLMSEHAVCAGLVLVSGCGNFQQSAQIPEQIRVPEGIPCIIGAGGLDKSLEVPQFCSLGPVEWGSVKFYSDYPLPEGLTKPDVCAFPGPGYPQLAPDNGDYIQNKRGNSFSSPHIAGVAALMLSASPELPAWHVKEIMEATATDVGEAGKDNHTGAGLVNAFDAVAAAQNFLIQN